MEIDFHKSGGLVPAIIQDEHTGDVLMLGFMNSESLAETQRTGEVVFFSRSRNKLWKKGESSGHVLRVRELRVDCDADALLVRVEAVGLADARGPFGTAVVVNSATLAVELQRRRTTDRWRLVGGIDLNYTGIQRPAPFGNQRLLRETLID